MSGRATTQAIPAAELTEATAMLFAFAISSTPGPTPQIARLVWWRQLAKRPGIGPSGEAPSPGNQTQPARRGGIRSRQGAPGTDQAAKTATPRRPIPTQPISRPVTEADQAQMSSREPPIARRSQIAASVAPAVPEPVAATPERALASRAFALVAALALAAVAAYFSVAGMAEIFPGDPVAVMVLAATMEAGKLVIAGWLAAHWRRTNWLMRFVLVALVAGLALINAAGVFGKLVEAHVSVAASSRSGVTERIEALDARVKAQSRRGCRPRQPHCADRPGRG